MQDTKEDADIDLRIKDLKACVAIADGVGGNRGGDVASKLAIQLLSSRYDEVADCETLCTMLDGISESIRLSCSVVSSTRGAATTIAGLVISEKKIVVFNVGDTRIYSISSDRLALLSEDHADPVDRRMLSRYLGGAQVRARPACFELNHFEQARFLICSDGLHGYLSDEEIYVIIKKSAGLGTVHTLINEALRRGSDDNISIAICDFR